MSEALRVLMVGPYPVGDVPVGGVESACRGLLLGLSREPRVDRVDVLDFRAEVNQPAIEQPVPGVYIHRLRAQQRMRLLNGAAADAGRATEIARSLNPHVVHGQGVGLTGKIAVGLGAKAVVTVHGMAVVETRDLSDGGLAGRLRVRAMESVVSGVLRDAAGVISISRYDQQNLMAYGIASKSTVIPNAITPREVESTKRDPVVLYAGVITARKNVVGVVEAWQRVSEKLPHARLRLAGAETDPDYAEHVRRRVRDLGLEESVEFLGSLDSAALAREVRKSTALVLFSVQETLPMIIAEAMLGGCPVVASSVGGVPEMVEDEATGLLVDAGDVDALAASLVRLLQDPDLVELMGARSQELARSRYDCDQVARATVDFYHRVLGAT